MIRPGPLGSLSALPDPLAEIRGLYSALYKLFIYLLTYLFLMDEGRVEGKVRVGDGGRRGEGRGGREVKGSLRLNRATNCLYAGSASNITIPQQENGRQSMQLVIGYW